VLLPSLQLTPNQKANLKLTPGCTITLMEYGHPGIPDTTDMVLDFGDARSVKLPLNQKANLKLTPGCTITLTGTGHHGGPVMVDMD